MFRKELKNNLRILRTVTVRSSFCSNAVFCACFMDGTVAQTREPTERGALMLILLLTNFASQRTRKILDRRSPGPLP